MMTSSTFRGLVTLFLVLATLGCGGSGLDGEYAGRIGDKMEVSLVFSDDGQVELRGYWPEPLNGSYEKASLRGEAVDALVFWGPEEKKFKLRVMYAKDDDKLEILGIHSRTIGPGARYVSTESESSFSPNNPVLYKVQALDD